MDKVKAQFLLQSFRPDGADAHLPEFAEALQLATEDRELAQWLANERAEDAAFATALQSLELPNSLRDDILSVLDFDGSGSGPEGELDALFVGGLASVAAPEGLRDQIISAMEMEQSEFESELHDKRDEGRLWKWLTTAAVAAVVAVVAMLSFDSGRGQEVVAVQQATVEVATALNSPTKFHLVSSVQSRSDAIDWLRKEELPVPDDVMPTGLDDAQFIGCQNLLLECGKPVSVMCFDKEGIGLLYLIVLNVEDIKDAERLASIKTLSLKQCYSCKLTKFHIAQWREGRHVYMLLTKANPEKLVELF